jgi:hypothetical protein
MFSLLGWIGATYPTQPPFPPIARVCFTPSHAIQRTVEASDHNEKGTKNLTFVWKMKNPNPEMGAKLKSKTHLQNTFFNFYSRFLRVLLQSFKNVLILPYFF